MKRLMMACVNGRRTIASDTFTRSNGALGTAEVGGAWTVSEGTFAIASNKAKGTANAVRSCAVLQMPQASYEVSADITWYTGEIVALVARAVSSDASNQMRARINGSTVEIERRISDSGTTLASVSFSWANAATKSVRFSCYGNDFAVFVDGALIASATDDNALKTNLYAGMLAVKSGSTPSTLFDNFLVMG